MWYLCGVIRVDVYIFHSKVAGEEAALCVSLAQVDGYFKFALLHGGMGGGLIKLWGACTVFTNSMGPDMDTNFCRIDWDAGVSSSDDNTAPVRIAT